VPSHSKQLLLLSFFLNNSALRSEDLLRTRGVAPSGFRPLRKIRYCCLPSESGPCLSSSVADHPLRSATHRRLGKPLPYQLANAPQAHPYVIEIHLSTFIPLYKSIIRY